MSLYQFNLKAANEMSDAGESQKTEIIYKAKEKMKDFETCVLNAKAEFSLMKTTLDPLVIENHLESNCSSQPLSFQRKLLEEIKPLL